MRILSYCIALALGEYLASFAPNYAETWPIVLFASAIVMLFGYGCALRGWSLLFFMLLGSALFLRASVPSERIYREKPWMRTWTRHVALSPQAETNAVLCAIKSDLSRRIALGTGEDHESADLSRAILLGERRRLSPQTRQLFVESGTMHVFAISGLHVMAVAQVLTYVLLFLFVPLRLTGLFAVPILWVYVWLIGFSPSAVRAATMATFIGLAPVFWRRPDGLRAWALTFLVVHLLRPLQIIDVGSALSFAVMLSVVVTGDFCRELSKVGRTVAVTVAAWAAGVPISAHVFGRVTPGGMIANLVLIGAAKATVVSGTVGLAASIASESLAEHLNNLGALMIHAMVLLAECVSRLPGANFDTGTWPLYTCVLWYLGIALVFFLVFLIRSRRRMI